MPPRNPPGAHGHEHGEDDRELLGQHAHGQREPGEHGLQQPASSSPIERGRGDRKGNAHDGEPAHEPCGLPLQRALGLFDARERAPDSAHLGIRAGGVHARSAPTLNDHRAGIDERHAVPSRSDRRDRRGSARTLAPRQLAYWNGFTGQQRLVGRQIVRVEQHSVGGNAIAFVEQQDVAGDDLPSGNQRSRAVPDDARPRTRKVAQGAEHALGLSLLHNRDAHHYADKGEEQQSFAQASQDEIEESGAHQHDEHRLGCDTEHDAQKRASRRSLQLVTTACGQARRRFVRGEAVLGRGFRQMQSGGHLARRESASKGPA